MLVKKFYNLWRTKVSFYYLYNHRKHFSFLNEYTNKKSDFDKNVYFCCTYIPPITSKVLKDKDFDFFEEFLWRHFNSLTALNPHSQDALLDFFLADTLPFTPDFGSIYDVKIVVTSYNPIILEDCSSNSCRASITTLKPKIRIN